MKLMNDAYYGFWSLLYVLGMVIIVPSGTVTGWENLFCILWFGFIWVLAWIIQFVYILWSVLDYLFFGDPKDEEYYEITNYLFRYVDSYLLFLSKVK